ncbi:ROK family protein [Catenovulum maritimum]|uniref:fructokinase n=1 Tax=Catenovulum maritimum TaxID=1513271 RepID=A0A0J8H0H7_9ALTE|nr:ROK family protein [Catenovulum maritimum]KMT66974.1 hypothetical protein XM47_02465 [Catenovulum maritimum]
MKYYAAIEAGGTKFNCALMNQNKEIIDKIRVSTTAPEHTLKQVVDFFHQKQANFTIESIGLASFGPMDLNLNSKNYGNITTTPKPHWEHFPLSRHLHEKLNLPIHFDTDVNGAILAESIWGAAAKCNVAVYITIGTGFGGGVLVNGQILNGIHHPEIGHMLIPSDKVGHCPYHGSCAEGLASGTSMAKTWNMSADKLEDTHIAWQQEAEYIASVCHNLIVTLGPEKIILGGGVMQKTHLFNLIIKETENKLANYLPLSSPLDAIIVEPGLGDISGLYGAYALAIGKGNHSII